MNMEKTDDFPCCGANGSSLTANKTDTIEVFIVWDMNADSWSGSRKLVSMHQTLDGAEETIPASMKTDSYDRTRPDDTYIRNYTYLAIEKRLVGV